MQDLIIFACLVTFIIWIIKLWYHRGTIVTSTGTQTQLTYRRDYKTPKFQDLGDNYFGVFL